MTDAILHSLSRKKGIATEQKVLSLFCQRIALDLTLLEILAVQHQVGVSS
ncbi:MAG TPA: hypothetical protein VGD98_25670 [Ktedonobacteraceae bacterium]